LYWIRRDSKHTAPATHCDQLRVGLTDFVADYVGQSIQEMDLSGAVNSLLEIIRRYSITLPPSFSLLLRTLVELEGPLSS
jgi:predicted unusual protein kinase regulating ubiquinone biosynthesis (AarF/ABC1/UbiB family)